MNYYEHHLGDYAKDTGHLSMLEHGAYRLLLDRYYSTDKAIHADLVYRVCRAKSREEKAAVDFVLSEFFTLVDGSWVNKKAEKVIAAAQKKISAARTNGGKGGRPAKNKKTNEINGSNKPNGFSVGFENETQQKAHQTPNTKHQTPVVLNNDSSDVTTVGEINPPLPSSSDPIQSRAIELTVLMRQRGAAIQAADPHVQQWAATGISDAQALTALDTAKQQRAAKGDISPINSGYLNSILQSQTNPQAKARASPGNGGLSAKDAERKRTADQMFRRGEYAKPNREIDITGSAVVVDGSTVRAIRGDVRAKLD